MGRSASVAAGRCLGFCALVAVLFSGCGEPVAIVGDIPGLMRIVAGIPDEPGRAVGSTGTRTELRFPGGLSMDLEGVLYLADRDNRRILAVTSAGTVRVAADNSGCAADCLEEPVDVVVDGTGGLIVADERGHRVWRYDAATGARTLLAGTGEAGTVPDGEPAASSPIRSPRGVAVDADGTVYYSEARSHLVRSILPDGTLATVAGTGEPGFSGDGGPASGAMVEFPGGIDISTISGVLYIADAGNDRIRAVDLGSGTITTVAGTGANGFSGDGGDPLSATMRQPRDVAVSPDGANLFIADQGNDRIRFVSLASRLINTFAGSGDTEFAGNLIDAGAAGLSSPSGVATSPFGLVLISDTDHHIVWRTTTGF